MDTLLAIKPYHLPSNFARTPIDPFGPKLVSVGAAARPSFGHVHYSYDAVRTGDESARITYEARVTGDQGPLSGVDFVVRIEVVGSDHLGKWGRTLGGLAALTPYGPLIKPFGGDRGVSVTFDDGSHEFPQPPPWLGNLP